MTSLFQEAPAIRSGATISGDGQYRYHLWRQWDETLPVMVFIMQNPSTADASDDDPTIRRCIGFARREQCGGISVRNVFALRATDERQLLTHPDPCGPRNDEHLLAARNVYLMTRLVVAWGNRLGGARLKRHYDNAATILRPQKPYCLGRTKSGEPKHPLFLASSTRLERW